MLNDHCVNLPVHLSCGRLILDILLGAAEQEIRRSSGGATLELNEALNFKVKVFFCSTKMQRYKEHEDANKLPSRKTVNPNHVQINQDTVTASLYSPEQQPIKHNQHQRGSS